MSKDSRKRKNKKLVISIISIIATIIFGILNIQSLNVHDSNYVEFIPESDLKVYFIDVRTSR